MPGVRERASLSSRNPATPSSSSNTSKKPNNKICRVSRRSSGKDKTGKVSAAPARAAGGRTCPDRAGRNSRRWARFQSPSSLVSMASGADPGTQGSTPIGKPSVRFVCSMIDPTVIYHCGGTAMVAQLRKHSCESTTVAVLLWWHCCGGTAVVALLWWYCRGGTAVVGLLGKHCCGGIEVVALLWLHCCGGTVSIFLQLKFLYKPNIEKRYFFP